MTTNSPQIIVFPAKNEPRIAFADGSWKNPMAAGPLGVIRWDGMGPASIAAHAGVAKGGTAGGAVMPIIQSTTSPTMTTNELADRFANAVVEGRMGNIYSRLGNRDSFELECALVGMHQCADGMVFGSGMAAISHAMLTLLTAGDNVVLHRNVYGCTDNLASERLPELGIESRFVDMRNPMVLRSAIDSRTRMVFFETPSNPTLDLIDIAAVVDETRGRCPVVVDNTFASPIGQDPFAQGAHIVIYSMTKSIGGHTDAIGGAVLASGPFMEHVFYTRKDIGGMLSAREAAAFLKGIKTLPIRYERMEQNARQVAQMLRTHGEVETIFYPEFDAAYPLGGQMRGPGYMIAFVLRKGMEGGKALIDNLKTTVHAVSLGSVETLICHPPSTTHACVPEEKREAKGIANGLIRLSVGIEKVDDVIGDLQQALAKVGSL